jgi:PhnB protein
MSMPVQPYLFFDGQCEAAIEFYRQAVGAEIEMLMRYQDSPSPLPPGTHAGYEHKVMHASLRIGDGSIMMADDCMGHPDFQGFSLSLQVADEAMARQRFNVLAVDGQVKMPLGKTFFSPCFGMVVDRFGVSWMVMVAMPDA